MHSVTLYKTQFQMDQSLQLNPIYTEYDRRESGGQSSNLWHRKRLSDQNTNKTDTKNN